MTNLAVVWLRRDLRVADQTALYYAYRWAKKYNGKLRLLFHIDERFANDDCLHHRSFFHSLAAFYDELQRNGVELQLVRGEAEATFQQLFTTWQPKALFFNEDETGYGKERDERIQQLAREQQIAVYSFLDAHLHGANDVLKSDGTIYKVFTPYYKAWCRLSKPARIELTVNELLPFMDEVDRSERTLIPLTDEPIDETLIYTEQKALERLNEWQRRVASYKEERDLPSVDATSKLSGALKVGAISPRTIFASLATLPDSEGKLTYVKELAWREFYNMIYAHHKTAKEEAIDERYRHLQWNDDAQWLTAWQEGKTGFPIVDAGMRQLRQEGWMHNRVRMIVASFLVKDLLLDWRLGERYFARWLTDYDEASNIGGWQWAASVGTDAVPYFRVFNPTTQSQKFDPNGDYIRRYVPELAYVSSKWIHEPHKMSLGEQVVSRCEIDVDYPSPIVDHKRQRERAIALFK